MQNYQVTITFETDKELNAEELDALETALITQVLEPATLDGENAEYQTYNQIIITKEGESK